MKEITHEAVRKLLNFLHDTQAVVFWTADPSYENLYFLSRSYEGIWGRSCQSLEADLGSWADTLLPEDERNVYENIFDERPGFEGAHAAFYRVQTPQYQIRHIKDTSFALANSKGEPTLITGVAESLNYEQWLSRDLSKGSEGTAPFYLKDVASLICREFDLTLITKRKTRRSGSRVPSTLYIGNELVSLTPREKQCLDYLLKGMSAKQTAFDLKLSIRTVESHLENLRRKTASRSKVELLGKIKDLHAFG